MSYTSSIPPGNPQSRGAGAAPSWSAVPPVPPPGDGRPPAAQLSRRKTWLTHGTTALVALLVGVGIGGNGDSGGKGDSAAPAPAVTVTKTAASEGGEPKPAATITEKVTVTPKPARSQGRTPQWRATAST